MFSRNLSCIISDHQNEYATYVTMLLVVHVSDDVLSTKYFVLYTYDYNNKIANDNDINEDIAPKKTCYTRQSGAVYQMDSNW